MTPSPNSGSLGQGSGAYPPPRLELGIDCLDPMRLAPFWLAALGYQGTTGDADPYLGLKGPADALPVFLQRVPDRKSVRNRLHLDLYTDRPEALCQRLGALGATWVGPPFGEPGDWDWQVMADAEGNEFCVCRERDLP